MTLTVVLAAIGWGCGIAFCVGLAMIAGRSDRAIEDMRLSERL